jgi:hypothetical protein
MPVAIRIGAFPGVSAASASGPGRPVGRAVDSGDRRRRRAVRGLPDWLLDLALWAVPVLHRPPGKEPRQQLTALEPVQALQGIRRADPLGLPALAANGHEVTRLRRCYACHGEGEQLWLGLVRVSGRCGGLGKRFTLSARFWAILTRRAAEIREAEFSQD